MNTAWPMLVWVGVSFFLCVLWSFASLRTVEAGRIGGLPFVDFEALFAEANTDSSDELQLDEFLWLTKAFFQRFSSLDLSHTDVEEKVAPRAFLWCDSNGNGALSLVEFSECTDHHYLYGQWINDNRHTVSSQWPPQLQQVRKFDPRDAVELQKGLVHFWKHGFSVFKALSATELNHAKVLSVAYFHLPPPGCFTIGPIKIANIIALFCYVPGGILRIVEVTALALVV